MKLTGSGHLIYGCTPINVGTILRDVAVGVDEDDDDDPVIEAERREYLVVEDVDGTTIEASFVKPTPENGWMKVPSPSKLIDFPEEGGRYIVHCRDEEETISLERVDLD